MNEDEIPEKGPGVVDIWEAQNKAEGRRERGEESEFRGGKPATLAKYHKVPQVQ